MDVLPLLCFLFARYLLKPSPRSLSLSLCLCRVFVFPRSLFSISLDLALSFSIAHAPYFSLASLFPICHLCFSRPLFWYFSSDCPLPTPHFVCIIQNIAKPPKNPTQKKAAIFAISHIILYGSIFWPFLCSLMKRKFVIWEYVRLFYSRRCILECIVHNEVYCFSQWRLTKGMV